uniref:RNase H type-1 domain-containing protein n=1 Tax=Quercus lobata TaxID=97700 RepID=A0A7N2L7W0_QUELO
MAAMTAKGPAVQDSDKAELLACRKALEFAIDAGFTVLIVEGDSVNATRCIALGKDNQSALGHVVGDIRHLMGAVEWSSVSCTKRNGNRVAHVLARYAQHVNSDLFWMEEYYRMDIGMERLTELWEGFSLSKAEGSRYQVQENKMEGWYMLAARFFTRRVLSMEAIA